MRSTRCCYTSIGGVGGRPPQRGNNDTKMPDKEATARIKINKLLEAAGWRFFADGNKPANIRLEPNVAIKTSDLDALGDNFEKVSKGFIDYLLLNAKAFPFIVLEAKAEGKNPLVGKEQARRYLRADRAERKDRREWRL